LFTGIFFQIGSDKIQDLFTLKRLYQKAVVHYHSDKIDEKIHGINWKVMSEEICKLLTANYEFLKGPGDVLTPSVPLPYVVGGSRVHLLCPYTHDVRAGQNVE
jgi:hypothetical protein